MVQAGSQYSGLEKYTVFVMMHMNFSKR